MMDLLFPINPRPISSKFGFRIYPKVGFHSGTDFAVPVDTAVHPCYKGYVDFVGQRGNYGLTVILHHPSLGNVWTLYAHLNKVNFKEQQIVTPDNILAFSGNSGWSTGPHLHLEVRVGKNGILFAKNPLTYLPKEAV